MDDIRIFVESYDAENTYKNIRENYFTKEYFKTNNEIFVLALLIGKYVLNEKKPLDDKKGFIRLNSIENKDEMNIITCFAINESNDINILSEKKEIFELCEEYANSGIKELKKWVEDEETFQNKLMENLLDCYAKNEKIISQYEK